MRSALLLMIVLFATGCVAPTLSNIEKSIVYQPVTIHPPQPPDPKKPQPGEFEEVSIPLPERPMKSSQPSLGGLLATAKKPRAVVLYCHGNEGNVEDCTETLRLFRDVLHVTILAFDYRNYGKSDGGQPDEPGLYADARLARKWLAQRTGVAEKDIILCGYSLGGGVAVELAANDGARGLILERTFTSIPDVADSHVLLPIGWLLESQYDSLSKIRNYHGPLLMTHGDDDRVVPYPLGKKLFRAANEPKQFVSILAGGHNDPPAPAYIAALRTFFDTLPATTTEFKREP